MTNDLQARLRDEYGANWKQHPKFTEYLISDDGRAFSIQLGRLLKLTVINKLGYLRISLRLNNKQYEIPMHRLVLETFSGESGEGLHCDHLDSNPSNNRIENLRFCTPEENAETMIFSGRSMRGQKHHQSKLTWGQVAEIRKRYVPRDKVNSAAALAREFGVRKNAIHEILSGKSWQQGLPKLTFETLTRQKKEIARLQGLVTKADALAEAALTIVTCEGGIASAKAFDALQTALTAFQEGK